MRVEVGESSEQRLQCGRFADAAIEIDTADLPGSPVEVEVSHELGIGGRGILLRSEIRCHPGARSEAPLLLAAPEHQPYSAASGKPERGENANRL